MNLMKRSRTLILGLALGAIPLITTATCDPITGRFDFFRDDDGHDLFDIIYEDVFYYDDLFYDGYYEEEFIVYY